MPTECLNQKIFWANMADEAAFSVAKVLDVIQRLVQHTFLTVPLSFLFVSIKIHGLPIEKRRNNWLVK